MLKIPPQGTVEHRPPSGIKPLFTVNLKLKYFVILTFLKIYSRAVCPLSLPIELACSVWGGEGGKAEKMEVRGALKWGKGLGNFSEKDIKY